MAEDGKTFPVVKQPLMCNHASGRRQCKQQEQFMRDHPDGIVPERCAGGRAGCTKVQLASIDEETLGHALTLAWRNTC